MTVYLDKNAVAERLGVQPRTAAALMMEMNPVIISGKTRKRIRVTEENLERWAMKKTLGKPMRTVSTGNKKRLERM